MFFIDLPWDNATSSCVEFASFLKTRTITRINLIPEGPRRIIEGILKLDPCKRWKLSEIMNDPWFKQVNPLFDINFMAADPAKLIQQIKENSSTQFSSYLIWCYFYYFTLYLDYPFN